VKRIIALNIVLAMVISSLAIPALAADPPPPIPYIVYGQVFESDGTTFASGADVEITNAAMDVFTTTTDGNGYFNLDINQASGDIDLMVGGEGDPDGYSGPHTITLSGLAPENIGSFNRNKADLSVSGLVISPAPKVTLPVTLTATIANTGTMAAAATITFVSDVVGALGTDTVNVSFGGTDNAVIGHTFTSAGSQDITVTITLVDKLETNTGNNALIQAANVAVNPEPDVDIISLNVVPASPIIGDDVTVTATIKNIGDKDLVSGDLTFKYDGGSLKTNATGPQIHRTIPHSMMPKQPRSQHYSQTSQYWLEI